MKLYPFNAAYSQAQDLYGVEMTTDDFENLGMLAWSKIGNKNSKLYRQELNPLQDELGTWYIDIPCNMDELVALTATYEDFQRTSSMLDGINVDNGHIENYIEDEKVETSWLYAPGKFIKHRIEEDRILLASQHSTVFLLYKGVLVDAEGLPKLSNGEIDAIAAFVSYTKMFKKALVTKDRSTLELSQMLLQIWKERCTQARVPEYISQNDMDEILDAFASWDRKVFGKSYKPFK